MTIMGLNAKRNTMTEGQALFKDGDLLKIDPERAAARSAATRSR